jgi:hypothetical protein
MTTPTASAIAIEAYLSSPAITETHFSAILCSSPICTASTSTRTLSTLCGHVFHRACLTKLLERSDRCAHCQTQLWSVPRANRTSLLRPPSRSPPRSPPTTTQPTSTPTASHRNAVHMAARRNTSSTTPTPRRDTREDIKRRKDTIALNKSCQNLNDISKGLHLVADTMQRLARDMQALTREVQMEKVRMISSRRRRMWQKRERIAAEKIIAKMLRKDSE